MHTLKEPFLPYFPSIPKQQSYSRKDEGLTLVFLTFFIAIFWSIRPAGFYGTGYDDTRYVQAAVNWLHAFPYLGTQHWDLRHPLNLVLAAAFYLFGVNQEVMVATCYVINFVLVISSYVCIRTVLPREMALLASLFFASIPAFAIGGISVEPLELLFCIISFWTFIFAAKTGRNRWLLISGLSLGLAWEVRETASFLIVLYTASFLFFPVVKRKGYMYLAIAASIPVILEVSYYYVLTGDILYRLHVDMNHIHVPSAHMVGKVSHETQPLFNIKLQKSWLPPNDYVPGFWLTYPFQALFIAPFIGLIPLVSLAGYFQWLRSSQNGIRSPLGMLALGGFASFIVSIYVLALRPDARYFLFTVYASCIFAALAICTLWQSRRRATALILCGAIFGGAILALQITNVNSGAYAAIAYLRSHDGFIFVAPDDKKNLDVDFRDPTLAGRITTNPNANRLHIADYPSSCPGNALWCAQPPKSSLFQGLRAVGLDRHIPPRLFARLSSGGTVAFVTPGPQIKLNAREKY